ncbi:MAG TPA: DNA cytosine methyltransferase, partial [Leclercia adecarboxylata]|nr:DNA cytosine methyltransferase [Leclercia adecarboxylata]
PPQNLYRPRVSRVWHTTAQDSRGGNEGKEKRVAGCANAGPPPFAEALVRANLPELCAVREQAA